jgi:hypothetical protein
MEWKTPPRPVRYKRSNTEWNNIAQALKENPNEWAKIAEDINPSTVTHIRKGRLKAFEPEGAFEASGHGRTEKGYTKELYARYIGKTASAPMASAETMTASPTTTAPSNPAVDFFNDPEL